MPQLSYPFVCWRASRLLPCPGYYKRCCKEQWDTCVSFRSDFLGVYAQTFALYGRRRAWDDLREQHQNMYLIKCETDRQSRLDAWDKCSGLEHWDDPEGWGGRWWWGSGWGTHVNTWLIHVNVWQKPLQYCKVISLQLIKINKKKRNIHFKKWWETSSSQMYCCFSCAPDYLILCSTVPMTKSMAGKRRHGITFLS